MRLFNLETLVATTVFVSTGASGCSPASPPPAGLGTASPAPAIVAPGPGDLPGFARRAIDAGRMDPRTPLRGMSLLFQMSPAQRARSRFVLADLQDPTSPEYHHWLTPARYATWFGPSPAQLATATAWLESSGFTVHGPSPTGRRLFFSGDVDHVERAFATEMHGFDVAGARHFAPAVQPTYPPEIGAPVLGVRGLHDFRLAPAGHPLGRAPAPAYAYTGGGPTDTSGPHLSIAPADFASIYDVTTLYAQGFTGAGQKIAVVGDSDYNDADILAFRKTFDLDTTNLPTRHLVPLSGTAAVVEEDLTEADFDLEWSGAIGRDAAIHYVFTGDNPAYNTYDAILHAIEAGSYPIISASYDGCEQDYSPSDLLFLEEMGDAAAMQGTTLVVSSGDFGPAACNYTRTETIDTYGASASFPASIPTVVAVGGTELDWGDPIPEPSLTRAIVSAAKFEQYWTCTPDATACAATGYIPETGWNEVALEEKTFPESALWGASGGGESVVFPKPPWQVGVTPNGQFRMVPDVALSAAYLQVGYAFSTSWTTTDGSGEPVSPEAVTSFGGTSAGAPSFAGILSLVSQAVAEQHPGAPAGLGNINPVLYALDASTSGAPLPAFHDITTGNNMVPCSGGSPCPSHAPFQFGYDAGPGYDLVTGLGSIDASQLAAAWLALAPTATGLAACPPATTAEGATVLLTATVASNATATPLTGSVIFYLETTDDAGIPDLSRLAAVPIVPTTSSGLQGGSAQLTTDVPLGLLGKGNVVASYSGDGHYLTSWSPRWTVRGTSTLAIAPIPEVPTSESASFTATGGVPPVVWTILRDTTCGTTTCSAFDPKTPGLFTGGQVAGTVLIAAVDADGSEARATVYVGQEPPDAGGADDASTPVVVGPCAELPEAGLLEAGPALADAGPPADHETSPRSSGCGCFVDGGSPHATLGGGVVAAALVLGVRWRRRAAARKGQRRS